MENPVADQLPDAHSLPDGFVDSSAEPLAQEKPLIDYKEEKLVELDSRPELVVVVNEGKTEKSEKSRRFPVPLSENDGSDASKELELPIEGWSERSDCTSAMPELRESDEKCQSSEKAIEGTLETQAAHMKETSSTENAENNVKIETSKVKRKNTKRTCKSEKEFLEFTLKYQQVLAERDTAITVRDKLESLCRELQRQNKMLMDECKRVSTEGQNLRLDLSSKFRDAIKEVSNKLEEQKGDSMSQLKENEIIIRKFFKFRLRSNLKQLADQYALSEEQYEQKLKQKTLELQLADLKMQQQGEKLLQEQSQMMLYAEQVSQLLATEKNLRLQLTADGEKFQQFQDALVNSNEVFETFKQEIDKMAKSIKELRKENTFLKSKCEKSDITLVELVEEREHLKKQLEKTRNQKEKLESLCRSLQEERKQNSIVGEQTTLIQ
ncbi:beta-taxilin-like isoform X1 [Camellia sinensis]|uniref:beta-taxilin-like isoform X1 n=1 Tax=Camellia sinensis TaxID=4442 RepID=UPI0010367BD0|nr:beta-taxilin-like isoform X1 [Camellia sinensis]XP_028126961.1 beta-taxilin-like isoform X1 [Camellia sinensis]XP_028126962.1 beta-taxilin-like isoform X1 [Camellia sinensis]